MRIQEMIEQFLPDYHYNSDVAIMNDLQCHLELGTGDYADAFIEYNKLQNELYEKAYQEFKKSIIEIIERAIDKL